MTDQRGMTTLSQVVDVLDSRRVPVNSKERAERSGVVPYYGATGRVGWIDEPIFDEDLVLLGEDGVQFFDRDKPKAYLVSGPAWVNNHAHVLRTKSDVDRRWLCHWLNYVDYRGFANGTTRLKLTQASMRRLPVWAPPVDEQRRLVAVLEDHLSRLDAADAYLVPTHRRVEAMRLSTVQRRLAGALREEALLDSLLDASIGGVWGSGPGEDAVDVAVLRVTELRPGGRLDESTAARRSVSAGQFASRALRPGDLLLEKSGGGPKQPIGRVGLVETLSQASVCANFMQLMRPNALRVLPRFLHLYLNHLHTRGDTLSMQKASTNIRNIKASEYLRLPVMLPDMQEQHQIVAEVAALDAETARLRAAAEVATRRSRALRRALLTAAFTGRLTGRSSDMDVAEELAEAAS